MSRFEKTSIIVLWVLFASACVLTERAVKDIRKELKLTATDITIVDGRLITAIEKQGQQINRIERQVISLTEAFTESVESSNVRTFVITGYHPSKWKNKNSLGGKVTVGKSVAVSPACQDWLGCTVYIPQLGLKYIDTLTDPSLDDKREYCTIDVALPDKMPTSKIGKRVEEVVLIERGGQ